MKNIVFFVSLFLFLGVPAGVFATLETPKPLPVTSIGERSATLRWDWNAEGEGAITHFELLVNVKRDLQHRPVDSCSAIASWGTSEHPGAGQRSYVVRDLERVQTHCWKIIARAADPADDSNFVFGKEFKTKPSVEAVPVCGNGACEPPTEDPDSCPADCASGGDGGDGGDGGPPPTLENPISAENITELFNNILNFLFGLSIFLVPVIVIYAAFLMLMGGGDPVKLAKGRMILLWTAIAFMLILLSKGLPVVFKNLL